MMKRVTLASAAFALASFYGIDAKADELTLTGPDLPYHNTGWPDTGLSITALQHVLLESFTFVTFGAPDIITLRDMTAGTANTVAFAGGAGDQVITVNWELPAGHTFLLLSADPNNSTFAVFNSPTGNSHITVNGGYGQFVDHSPALYPEYWFHFNDLTTITLDGVAPVPEPSSVALLVTGIAGLLAYRRRRA